MKKIVLMAMFAMFCFTVNAQDEVEVEEKSNVEFKVGLNYGLIAGDDVYRDKYCSNLGIDFTYLHHVTKDIALGATAGLNYLKADEDSEYRSNHNEEFLVVGAAIRLFTDNDKLFIGGDVGYGYGIDDGGFYFSPKVGFQLTKRSGLILSYKQVKDMGTFSSFNIGYEFSFFK